MPNRLMPAPNPAIESTTPETPVEGFTDFFRKAKSLGCFPEATDAPLSHAFASKRVIHAGGGGHKPVTGDEAKALWTSLSATPVNKKRAAYIHVPFCTGKCIYCGFYINPMKEEISGTYANAVICELKRDGALTHPQSGPIHALYFGGGTPTALAPCDLARIIEAAHRNLPLANDCEITIEGRIADMTPEMIRATTQAGANRFSLGVQSFDTDLRRSMGRKADRNEVIKTLSTLMATDQAAVIIDLIYGLPGQTQEIWQKDLRTLFDLGLDGADLYQLNVFKGGTLDKAIQKGALPPAADLPAQSALFKIGVEAMAANNYRRISASHWAGTPRERNIYNLLMKQKSPCLPFGSCAGGMVDGHLVIINDTLTDYLAAVGTEKPVSMIIPPKENHRLAAHITGEMETLALDLSRLGSAFGETLPMALLPLIHCWEETGLVHIDDHLMRPTTAGEFWQVNLTQGLIDYLTLYREMGCPEPCI
ncbi:heme anaerobic degradation radical SAM methyltransferase ChuW/HutW [Desulfoluna sp.]|uniref:heme anaerobic degradation radical SAM methyltransferase ChuW/HutW n=1 Tax=Desulfoluna sp. TaxID=2045199 RepID=UPI00262721FF|nr:heme anaerobic degradation radical SAM methyltransferase ChuW/HutW [Desulfoluna sp.]